MSGGVPIVKSASKSKTESLCHGGSYLSSRSMSEELLNLVFGLDLQRMDFCFFQNGFERCFRILGGLRLSSVFDESIFVSLSSFASRFLKRYSLIVG